MAPPVSLPRTVHSVSHQTIALGRYPLAFFLVVVVSCAVLGTSSAPASQLPLLHAADSCYRSEAALQALISILRVSSNRDRCEQTATTLCPPAPYVATRETGPLFVQPAHSPLFRIHSVQFYASQRGATVIIVTPRRISRLRQSCEKFATKLCALTCPVGPRGSCGHQVSAPSKGSRADRRPLRFRCDRAVAPHRFAHDHVT